MDLTQIHSSNISNTTYQSALAPYRNRIIGGDFSTNPWQRGTSFTDLGSGSSAAYGPDRFGFISNSPQASYILRKSEDAPTLEESGIYTRHCVDIEATNNHVTDTSTSMQFYQYIEGYNIADMGFGQPGNRYFTVSFWHKHTQTGTYLIGIKGTGFNRTYLTSYTQTASETWEKAVLTIPVDTGGTYNYENGHGINLVFVVIGDSGSGTPVQSNIWVDGNFGGRPTDNQVNTFLSTGNHFRIALVQLEAGDKATRFETRSVGHELELCKRYYQKDIRLGVYTGSSGPKYLSFIFPEMRANPIPTKISDTVSGGDSGTTMTVLSPSGGYIYNNNISVGGVFTLNAEL